MSSRSSGSSRADSAPNDLFVLPNGAAVPYRLPSDKGDPWRTWDLDYVRHWASDTKSGTVKICGWASKSNQSNQHLVIADFDRLLYEEPTVGFSTADHWSPLRSYLRMIYQGKGIVLTSFSGKCKVIFVVETPKGVSMNRQIALDTLQSILPDDLFEIIDKSTSALSLTILTPGIINILSKELPNISVIPCILDSIDLEKDNQDLFPNFDETKATPSNTSPPKECYISCIPTHKYKSYEGELGCLAEFEKGARGKILRVLCAMPRLRTGFDISQIVMAKTVGVSQKTVHVNLQWFISKGLLKVTNGSYRAGKKAMTYQAAWLLLETLDAVYRHRTKAILPTAIANGEWTRTLRWVALTFFRLKGRAYLTWALSIPGIERKDRLRQAKHWAKWLDDPDKQKQYYETRKAA